MVRGRARAVASRAQGTFLVRAWPVEREVVKGGDFVKTKKLSVRELEALKPTYVGYGG